MKKLLLLSLLLIFVTSSSFATGIEFFHGTWKEAMQKAADEDKLLFVDAYATWCGPCKRMAKNVFTKDEVGDYFNKNFINLKLDMEKADGITFGKEYPVSAYPTLFFLAGDGTVVSKIRGGQKAAQLIEHGKKATKGYDRSGQFEERYAKGERGYDLMYDYIKALVQADKPHSKITNEYLRSEPDITDDQLAELTFVAATEPDSKAFETMVLHKDKLLAEHGEEAWNQKVKAAVMVAVDKAIEYDYPELLDDAITMSDEQMTDGAKATEAEARMLYATRMGNSDEYVKYAKKYLKANKYNGKELRQVITSVQNEHSDSPEALDLAADCIKKVQKYGKLELGQALNYARLLKLADHDKQMNKILDKLKEEHGEDKRKMSMIERAEEKINKIKPVGK